MSTQKAFAVSTQTIRWEQIASDLFPIACELNPHILKRKARDYFWFSPILKAELAEVSADIVVAPSCVDELKAVVAYFSKRQMSLTPRGGGTGNYGQAMPLKGGAVLDMSLLKEIVWVRPDAIRAQAGATLLAMEQAAHQAGAELRFFPSTIRQATVGGFVAGGTTGCGAMNFGTLHSDGNVRAALVMTMDDEPKLIELRGKDAQAVVHAYGVNGIIVEVELALAPLRRWHDRILGAPDLPSALTLADRIVCSDAVRTKQFAMLGSETAALMRPISQISEPGEFLLIAMVEEATLTAFDKMVTAHAGRVLFEREPDRPRGRIPPLYELCWNHTTLHAISREPNITYLQLSYPKDYRSAILEIEQQLRGEALLHLEYTTIDGEICCFGIPLLRYADPARLDAVHRIYQQYGCSIFSPHTYLLENGGMQVADPTQLAFRQRTDPRGLLNPGKMPGFDAPSKLNND